MGKTVVALTRNLWFLAITSLLCSACNDQFLGSLLPRNYPHQRYEQRLRDAGLETSELFRLWYDAAVRSLGDPTPIHIPHQEEAFIAGSRPGAIGYVFSAQQGERIQVAIQLHTTDSTALFIDLFEGQTDTAAEYQHVISADTGALALTWDVRRSGSYILRIQPELLVDISFQLELTAVPTLENPVARSAKQHVGSFFGDARDGGGRQHEGIDIFAARSTPVVAAANGMARAGTNKLGGKVVWLQLDSQPVTLYYAHLDSQLITGRQVVKTGDTLGLMGNTGNARTTPPHLHFGIYGTAGAVDPLPFVQVQKKQPPAIRSDAGRIGDTVRIRRQTSFSAANVPVKIEAAVENGFRIIHPDKHRAFIAQNEVVSISNPLRTIRPDGRKVVYVRPDTGAARKRVLNEGERVRVVGEYDRFLLIQEKGGPPGWILR